MGWNDFRLAAVGTRHSNDDGSSRQDELGRCYPGERVSLTREPHNEHDPRAVAIISARGVCIGYLARDHAGWVGSKIDRGYDVRAIVDRIKGEDMEGSPLGMVVLINMQGDDPELRGEAGKAWVPEAVAAE
jgi:hypothetical protein